ncbi:MAG: tRNA (N(6)-L-threonylcarbamoyladenosine(37)-C(2))-methylthiotransferase MtaB [Anaerolineae bacterium]|nr:tRNA (N(6)-L-threonylcarbamoyladenosine(37)-C(2))-methylthiotransferase MtaB [Anaerolineae bacterium]
MRIYLDSLGCKLNQAEMEELAVALACQGHELAASAAEADVCVLNTCAVTHVAAQKSRQALRRLNRDNPAARIIATGCYAELSPNLLAGLPGVEQVVGNAAKAGIAALLAPAAAEGAPGVWPPLPRRRTRALVKVQDGCDNACTYCITRLARGPQRSRPPEHVIADVRRRVEAGYREVVLTGVHVGAYGRDRDAAGSLDLWALVGRILAETAVERLRLSSIEPWDLPEEAFALWSDARLGVRPRLCRHLHLPLQSGCDATLRRMARRYTTARFERLVRAARAAIPGLAVTTDLIAGFPGETEEEFAASLAFVERMAFAGAHVFPYSMRPGTAAAQMQGQVPAHVAAGRAQAMRAVAARAALEFRQHFLGQTLPVLWESARQAAQGQVWSGLTDNYLRVHAVHDGNLANQIRAARLVRVQNSGLWGEILE